MEKHKRKQKRKLRIKAKVFGGDLRPRLSLYKSSRHLFAQIVNDQKGVTLASVSDLEAKKGSKSKKEVFFEAGKLIAQKAIKKKVKSVVFDRGGFKYHGHLSEFAKGAREGGLDF